MQADLFAPVHASRRGAMRADYRAYLRARDGELDVPKRTLEKREGDMDRFLVRGGRDIDRALFARQYARFAPDEKTSPELLLLLALVKVNAAEAWGVGRTFDGALARAKRSADDTELVLLVEEVYHTKILLSAACLYDLDVHGAAEPHVGLRALIAGIAKLPEAMARPLTLAAEMLGVLVFMNLLETARSVLKEAPEVRDAVEERLIEILIDEIGHVSFQRLCLGRAGLLQAKALLPVVARGLANAIPEVRVLGAAPDAPFAGLASLRGTRVPEAVQRRAFVA